nr:immunoglobulin heavy chain junction region [Mus musculus]
CARREIYYDYDGGAWFAYW